MVVHGGFSPLILSLPLRAFLGLILSVTRLGHVLAGASKVWLPVNLPNLLHRLRGAALAFRSALPGLTLEVLLDSLVGLLVRS